MIESKDQKYYLVYEKKKFVSFNWLNYCIIFIVYGVNNIFYYKKKVLIEKILLL